jgi:hypothetical protein
MAGKIFRNDPSERIEPMLLRKVDEHGQPAICGSGADRFGVTYLSDEHGF